MVARPVGLGPVAGDGGKHDEQHYEEATFLHPHVRGL